MTVQITGQAGTSALGTVTTVAKAIVTIAGVSGTTGEPTVLVWGLVDDAQTSNWETISDTQTPGWEEVA